MTIEFSAAADLWLESRCYQTPSALHGWLTGYLASGARLKPRTGYWKLRNIWSWKMLLKHHCNLFCRRFTMTFWWD